MCMNRAAIAVFVAATMLAWGDDLTITSFHSGGALVFDTVPSATVYRVQWAGSLSGPWTNFATAASRLDAIEQPLGGGSVTCSVPMFYRVIATVTSQPPSLPEGMVLVPAGTFALGNATNVFPESEGDADELPLHTIYVSDFCLDRFEVTLALWNSVQTWALTNGFTFENAGLGTATNHPVRVINWHDAVKWCNARSLKEALTPCYTVTGTIYRTSQRDDVICDWTASGYRLPTEAEWEKAARGGAPNLRFPWTDYTNRISHDKANYTGNSAAYPSYDLSDGPHPDYAAGKTSPVGSFAPNGYGLYDMAGNVMEWCWDWYSASYYTESAGSDPKGPDSGENRTVRGGSWATDASAARCASRWQNLPFGEGTDGGFRCARGR